jgi:hypothetical protein
MSHEVSETIQRKDGKWINVYGAGLPNAGQQLPDSGEYSTVDDAVTAARARSESFNHSFLDQARKEGYTPEEINEWIAGKASEAKAEGYTDAEIEAYVHENILGRKTFNETPISAQANRTLMARQAPTNLKEAIVTGYGWSTLGLGSEMMKEDGRLPNLQINDETPWHLRAAANLTGLVADVPAMISGGIVGGGPVSPITAVGGGFMLPQALRKMFVDKLEDNELGTRKEWADKATGAIWEGVKGWITGAATAGVGKAATVATSSLPGFAKTVLPTTAELATLTEVSARLEGHAPEPQALLDNAIVLGVAKAVLPSWTSAKPLTETYVKTGILPEQVVRDAIHEPKIWQDALDGRMSDAYKSHVEQPPPLPAPREFRTPPLTPEQQAQARAFFDQPFAEIPQMPNEPARPTHINYNYIDTPESAQQALAQLSTIYEAKIAEKQQSPRAWAQSHQDASKVLGDLLQTTPEKAAAFLTGQMPGPSTTAQLLARKELTLSFTEDLMRARAELATKGDSMKIEDMAAFLAKAERVSAVHAAFLGQRADVGRALNALKSTQREAEKAQQIIDAINAYGGEQNVKKLVDLLGEYDNPAQVVAFSRKATKATTWEMMVEAWKAGLVSGLRTNEVNFLSTVAFSALRLPTEAIAAAYGAIKGHEERVLFSEIPARALGMMAGLRAGAKTAGAIIRSGVGEEAAGKLDQARQAIPGKVGELVRLPFRPLRASDALLRAVNEHGQAYADATKLAMQEGKTFGSKAFFERVVDLVQDPTQEMIESAKAAGDRYTFNRPLGEKGKQFQKLVKMVGLEPLFPFIATPGNIFKETMRMTPGARFAVREWREDYEAGGARRDRAMAEVTVGGLIMGMVLAGASEGLITGNGTPDKGLKKTHRAAGWRPYAVKIGDQYYDGYIRMAPIGPLIGLAVDGYEFSQYMTGEERDQWGTMMAFAFAQNVTNQTFMTGMTNFVSVLQEPSRYGQNYFEMLASSAVPGILGQTAGELDPLMREIHSVRDAMIARVPLMREGLMPQKDFLGQPIKSPERLWFGSPFSTSAASTDKVRTEAARIGFATPDIPKKMDVLPGARAGTLDYIDLTPEQRDVFATVSGQLAYSVLEPMVNAPRWDRLPAIAQRRTYEMVFKKSRDYASKQVLLGLDPSVTQQAIESVRKAYEQ